jgi:hypothetical protein
VMSSSNVARRARRFSGGDLSAANGAPHHITRC